MLESEKGTVRKNWSGRTKIALVYPNQYHVGMSNLGFQAVYQLLNRMDAVVCERAFLPDDGPKAQRLVSLESGRPLGDFDIVAFSISFENDFPNLLTVLEKAALPLKAIDRGNPHPLVMAGGVACFSNPEPIAEFIDLFVIGEAEPVLTQFVERFDPGVDRATLLKSLAQNIPGIYVPAFYQPRYRTDGTLSSFRPLGDVPPTIKRVFLDDLSRAPTTSAIITSHTTFGRSFLVETGRGCPHGCRFCSAGYIYRPPRFVPLPILESCLEKGRSLSDKVGLVGAAVSNLPEIEALCSRILHSGMTASFSSLRADALSAGLVGVLKQSGVKTATIAPDAGSQRLRAVINKGISEADILNAAQMLIQNGIPNLKLYFMIGLPTETSEDVDGIVSLCKRIKHTFLKSSRARKRIGDITVGLNSFVPKPFTPFQWAPMDEVPVLKDKIKTVRKGLKPVANVRLHADIPRWAYLQALFSRGDRRVADLLLAAHSNRGNWPQTFKESPLNPAFYVHRERYLQERFPWDFIEHGLNKSFLEAEYKKALKAKPSPPCPMESCQICGVCRKSDPLIPIP
ncbi:MAG: radical SAM protein [Desulfobacterales bacterium]|nr:radical SAM protein [Desulfobacterales bacterium]